MWRGIYGGGPVPGGRGVETPETTLFIISGDAEIPAASLGRLAKHLGFLAADQREGVGGQRGRNRGKA